MDEIFNTEHGNNNREQVIDDPVLILNKLNKISKLKMRKKQ